MRSARWRTHSRNEHQKAIEVTDRIVSLMIRERDADLPCVVCKEFKKAYDNGHFRRRELMPTRYHPWNCNKECVGCNRQDFSGFRENKGYEYGLAIDEKWGAGVARFLYQLSQKIEPWETKELEQLRSAARMGPRAYEQLYFELRPDHAMA